MRPIQAFTLIELLVVMTIVSILAAIIFPVFANVREKSRASACLSHMREIGISTEMYNQDNDQRYPQSKASDPHPEIGDYDGAEENPDNGSNFAKVLPYTGHGNSTSELQIEAQELFACPDDPAPFNPDCPNAFNVGGPHVISYVYNAYFAFGLNEAAIDSMSQTIMVAERRSSASKNAPDSYCDDIYHPWFNASNPNVPTPAKGIPNSSGLIDEMDAAYGAIATSRHAGGANYIFADSHAHWEKFERTFDLAHNINVHKP